MTTLETKLDLSSSTTIPVDGSSIPNSTVEKVAEKVASTPLTPEYTELYTHCRERYVEAEELLEFAVKRGKLEPPSLATEIKNLKQVLYYTPESAVTGEQLCQTEASLEMLYTKIAHLVAPVTIDSLRATSDEYTVIQRPWWSSWLLGSFSTGRNFLRQLFWVGFVLLLIMFLGRYIRLALPEEEKAVKNILDFGMPFLYGAIGAWLYLSRALTGLYSDHCLHPQEWPTYWLRLFTGALGGGVIVHFIMPEMQSVGANTSTVISGTIHDNAISQTAVGLLAGYSVEFLYGTLDRLIEAILPPKKEGGGKTPPPTAKQMETEALLKRLNETENESDKATIRAMLEKL